MTLLGLVYYKSGGLPLPWNIDACFMAIPFFFVGCVLKQFKDILKYTNLIVMNRPQYTLKLEDLDNSLIELLRKGESLSNHPIAKSIMKLSNKKEDVYEMHCIKEQCAWWLEDKQKCAITALGGKK